MRGFFRVRIALPEERGMCQGRLKQTDDEKPRGEGSVLQRESDGRWVASVSLGGEKKKQEYYDTRAQAERARRKMLQDLEQGKLLTTRDQASGDYLEYWLSIQRSSLKPMTSTYRRCLMLYVSPVLGQVKLRKLSGDMFQSLYTELLEDGDFSPNTVRYIHAVVKKALNDALRWRKITFNPGKMLMRRSLGNALRRGLALIKLRD